MPVGDGTRPSSTRRRVGDAGPVVADTRDEQRCGRRRASIDELDAAAAGVAEGVARDLRHRRRDARLVLRVEAEQRARSAARAGAPATTSCVVAHRRASGAAVGSCGPPRSAGRPRTVTSSRPRREVAVEHAGDERRDGAIAGPGSRRGPARADRPSECMTSSDSAAPRVRELLDPPRLVPDDAVVRHQRLRCRRRRAALPAMLPTPAKRRTLGARRRSRPRPTAAPRVARKPAWMRAATIVGRRVRRVRRDDPDARPAAASAASGPWPSPSATSTSVPAARRGTTAQASPQTVSPGFGRQTAPTSQSLRRPQVRRAARPHARADRRAARRRASRCRSRPTGARSRRARCRACRRSNSRRAGAPTRLAMPGPRSRRDLDAGRTVGAAAPAAGRRRRRRA